jgi:phenylalanine-4-hydroxylase
METAVTAGLTTGEAPFIEDARSQGDLYITQPYELYTPANHQAWSALYERLEPRWERYANRHFLDGIGALCLPKDRIPRLDDVNRYLARLTGFRARAVSGYVPAYRFFESLGRREFPTTITIRRADHLDYLPEPDIFHDVAGHVPMHTDPQFAEALVRFGKCARTAAEIASAMPDPFERLQAVTSMIRALARFFWFTVEFGLMKEPDGLKAYGSGLLSSFGEIEHAVASPEVQRFPMQIEWAINQAFVIDHYQPLLFVVDSFDHLYSLAGELEQWMKDGRLSNVAPGEPSVNEADLRSFLDAA